MPQTIIPKDWEPPYPSWSAEFTPQVSTVVAGYFAAQYKEGDITGFRDWMQLVLSVDDAPLHHEQACFVDTAGYKNHVYICYWTSPVSYLCWRGSPRVTAWWDDPVRLNGVTGYWREVIFAPMERLETLFSSEDAAGMATLTPGFTGPIREHGYWGGMRDRIPASAVNCFHRMVQQLEFQLDLKLWHEVIVLPHGPHVFEYVNCHENTGLLPYFPPVQGVN